MTLVTLAAELGVSRQTISNVLNAPSRVKEETRVRVVEAIARSGYRPNSAARQLRNRTSMNLGMRLRPAASDGVNGAVLDGFLHGLTEAAQDRGYRLTLFCADTDEQEIHRYEELLSVADLDGFVLTSTNRDDQRTVWLTEHEVPFVTFGRPWNTAGKPVLSQHSWVDVDGRSGVREATEHLLAQGHQQIAFLGWPAGSGVGDDRWMGWVEAMTAAGIPDGWSALRCAGDDSVPAGSTGAAELLGRGATSFICASDSLALGASAYLWQSHHPDAAASVIGFDNTPVAAAVGVSSISQLVRAAAREVIRLMLRQLQEPGGRPEPVLLAPKLELRDLQRFTQ
ncbi:LacI family DNA-binding transcriptional regulator [Paenarthrobacter sp. Z7-10]|uniref:LacI family DNA-binding transcriptional regulator n=1 Tax=Paenarthrobacter sp. Z7-10 TaxID=2787635 RepID=UPI0022A96F50|nr:substrate-binding domain-containing protein [Paenarthrobacter sp. Z7-10]